MRLQLALNVKDLEAAGLEHEVQEEEVCCFANQNKVITHDVDGTMWEWYRVLGDSQTFFDEEPAVDTAVPPSSQRHS